MQSQTSKERVKLAASCVVWTCDLVDTSAEGAGTREDGGRPGDDGEAEDEESVWMRTICGRLMHIARAFATQIYECHEVRIHGSLTSLLALCHSACRSSSLCILCPPFPLLQMHPLLCLVPLPVLAPSSVPTEHLIDRRVSRNDPRLAEWAPARGWGADGQVCRGIGEL